MKRRGANYDYSFNRFGCVVSALFGFFAKRRKQDCSTTAPDNAKTQANEMENHGMKQLKRFEPLKHLKHFFIALLFAAGAMLAGADCNARLWFLAPLTGVGLFALACLLITQSDMSVMSAAVGEADIFLFDNPKPVTRNAQPDND